MGGSVGPGPLMATTGRMVTDMKRLLITLLILFAPSISLAGTAQVRAMMGMWGRGASPVCTYTSEYSNQTYTDNTGERYTDSGGFGGSWSQPSSATGVKVYFILGSKYGTLTGWKMRIGTSPNMSSSYIAEVTFSVTAETGSQQVVEFPTASVSAGTVYWIATGPAGGVYENRISLGHTNTAATDNAYDTTGGWSGVYAMTREWGGHVETCR